LYPQAAARLDFEAALNDEQRAVVMAPPGATRVIAGAGTGKTRALTYRVARLVAEGAAADRILLCTFTNRAAREMLGRVELLARVDSRAMWAGTLHRVANRVLRGYGKRLGLDPGYGILDRDDARELLGRCLDEEAGAAGGVRGRLPAPGLFLVVLSRAAAGGLTLEGSLRANAPRLLEQGPLLLRAARRFQQRKARLALLDFDDLLVLWKLLLEDRPEVERELSERFQHVLVDEYQDLSPLQAELVERSAGNHRDITVVGDDAQSIYAFRGAEVGLLLDFPRRFPGARTFTLETNYRSTPEILAVANRSIAANRRRYEKRLQAVRGGGARPALVAVEDAPAQARFVAERVQELQRAGRGLSEIAVLYRNHAHSLEIQVELARCGLPHVVRSGPRLVELAHVKDVVAVLRVRANARDELSWARLLKRFPGIGPRAALAVLAGVGERGMAALSDGALARSLPRAARAGLVELSALMERLDQVGERPAALLREAVAGWYRGFAEGEFEDAEERLGELEQLAGFAERYVALEDFLSDFALLASAAAEGPLLAPGRPGALVLSTVHQAKGLEWACVFVAWLADGHFPGGVVVRASEEEEEERRLFHVAVTRARDELYLCCPEWAPLREGARGRMLPSRFAGEVAGEVERWEAR
jgi:ATP-dependent DNA helicase UvrD/PcrA